MPVLAKPPRQLECSSPPAIPAPRPHPIRTLGLRDGAPTRATGARTPRPGTRLGSCRAGKEEAACTAPPPPASPARLLVLTPSALPPPSMARNTPQAVLLGVAREGFRSSLHGFYSVKMDRAPPRLQVWSRRCMVGGGEGGATPGCQTLGLGSSNRDSPTSFPGLGRAASGGRPEVFLGGRCAWCHGLAICHAVRDGPRRHHQRAERGRKGFDVQGGVTGGACSSVIPPRTPQMGGGKRET